MLFRARFSPTVTRTPTPAPASPMVHSRAEELPTNEGPSTNEASSPVSYRNSTRTSMSVPVNASEDGLGNTEASELPPPYDVARTPDHPVTYTFSRLSVSSSSMLLLPPSDSADQQPLYHIAVGFDPFNPGRIITSVRRGGTEDGAYVGGIRSTSGPATFRFEANAVSIRKHEYPLFRIFSKFSVSKGVYLFTWDSGGKREMMWSCPGFPSPGTYSCRHRHDSSILYAEFTPARQYIRPSRSQPKSKLTMMPQGHALFDDILISVLLLERHRLTEA